MSSKKETPWACIQCNQLNSYWATECGRCGLKMRREIVWYRDNPKRHTFSNSDAAEDDD